MDIVSLVKKSNAQSSDGVKILTLSSLRFLRDNCPKEWDNLLAADENNVMVTLWDYLKNLEN